jgi:hypothetical protein
VKGPLGLLSRKYVLHGSKAGTIKAVADFYSEQDRKAALSAFHDGFADHPSHALSEDVLGRIVAAFRKAKEAQRQVAAEYQVGRQWQHEIDAKAKPVVEALDKGDTGTLNRLFANQQRSSYAQSWGGYGDLGDYQNKPLFQHEYVATWLKHFALYKEIVGHDQRLVHPQAGNPVGLLHDGVVTN